MRSNQARHCERSEAIQGMKGRSGSSGSPRRFAPRDDNSIRPHLALGGGLRSEALGETFGLPTGQKPGQTKRIFRQAKRNVSQWGS